MLKSENNCRRVAAETPRADVLGLPRQTRAQWATDAGTTWRNWAMRLRPQGDLASAAPERRQSQSSR